MMFLENVYTHYTVRHSSQKFPKLKKHPKTSAVRAKNAYSGFVAHVSGRLW